MALKTTGLKKRKKKGSDIVYTKGPGAKKRPKLGGPGFWYEDPKKPRPKKPPVRVKPGPGKPIKGPKIPGLKPSPGKPPGLPPKKPGKPGIGGPGKPPGKAPKRPGPAPNRPGPPPKGTKPGKPNFGGYVKKHPDLAAAFKKHKAKGGTGPASEWGERHYKAHGKREKRKLS